MCRCLVPYDRARAPLFFTWSIPALSVQDVSIFYHPMLLTVFSAISGLDSSCFSAAESVRHLVRQETAQMGLHFHRRGSREASRGVFPYSALWLLRSSPTSHPSAEADGETPTGAEDAESLKSCALSGAIRTPPATARYTSYPPSASALFHAQPAAP